jgi:hypothetical protein
LISTAAARTQGEQILSVDDGLPVPRETAKTPQPREEHPHRAGLAMMLAALALMSGIALRRDSSMK